MESEEAVEALSALAHRTRLAVFRMLASADLDGVPAGEIARALGVPPTTLSSHLSVLASAGVVKSRRVARTIFYSVRPEGVRDLLAFLTADCCGGRPDLCAPVLCEPAACDAPARTSPGRVSATNSRRA
jgi:DNA-binding transcriptional ArsR family regulator